MGRSADEVLYSGDVLSEESVRVEHNGSSFRLCYRRSRARSSQGDVHSTAVWFITVSSNLKIDLRVDGQGCHRVRLHAIERQVAPADEAIDGNGRNDFLE